VRDAVARPENASLATGKWPPEPLQHSMVLQNQGDLEEPHFTRLSERDRGTDS
jgi:hypothetical protein